MKTHIMKALGAIGSAGALMLLTLIGSGGAALASPSSVGPAQGTFVGSLKVPGSFQPAAASFVSPAWGVVLGQSGHTSRAQLAVTADGGAHWSLMRTPAVWLDDGGSWRPRVNKVVFADRANGWLYDASSSSRIWVTHNGGLSWRGITLPGNIQAMAASAHAVYAVAGNRLYSSPPGGNGWMRVNAWTRSGPMTGTALAVSGSSVWFGGGRYVWATADGVRWARYLLRAPGAHLGEPYALAGIAAASPRYVAFLYAAPAGMFRTSMKVLVSFNAGRSQWQTLAAPPSQGDVAGFAVTPGRFAVISIAVVTPGPDNIYRSADLGQSWATYAVPGTSGGAMLGSLQFMSPAVGCLVAGHPGPGIGSALLWTMNAGRTWYPVRF